MEIFSCFSHFHTFSYSSGKTSFLQSLAKQSSTNKASIGEAFYNTFEINVKYQEASFLINFVDTPGEEDYAKLRSTCYTDTDVFIVMFCVISETSFLNVTQLWVPEIKKISPRSKIILVGSKTDLRNDPTCIDILKQRNQTPITTEAGKKLGRKLRAPYVEISSSEDTSGFLRAVATSCGLRKRNSIKKAWNSLRKRLNLEGISNLYY